MSRAPPPEIPFSPDPQVSRSRLGAAAISWSRTPVFNSDPLALRGLQAQGQRSLLLPERDFCTLSSTNARRMHMMQVGPRDRLSKSAPESLLRCKACAQPL
eukprot:1906285-Rhodomonas_salina.1